MWIFLPSTSPLTETLAQNARMMEVHSKGTCSLSSFSAGGDAFAEDIGVLGYVYEGSGFLWPAKDGVLVAKGCGVRMCN